MALAKWSGMNAEPKKRRKWKAWRIVLIVVVVLVAIRIALPYILLDQLNKRLKEMPEYYGHADDLSLALLRGAYTINDVYLDQQDSSSQVRTPFVAAEVIDLSLEWRALFDGEIVGELVIERPIVRFTKDYVEPAEVSEDTVELGDLLDDLMPLRINRFEIHNGAFEFHDPTASPEVHLAMERIELYAENLTTVKNEDKLLPAYVSMDADVYEGRFYLDIDLDPLASAPTFDMAVEVKDADLTLFNEFFQAYANFDISSGIFGMYSEVAAKDGKFLGYVKPVIKDLEVLGPNDRDKNIGKKIWEGLVGLGGMLLTNPKEEQIATRVPLEGELENPDVRTWYAVIDLLRNAFIRALEPELDNDINIRQVDEGYGQSEEGFFQRLFKGDGTQRQERLERREQRRKDQNDRDPG